MVSPSDSLTPRAASESPMSRAPGTERASRSSFGTYECAPGSYRRERLAEAWPVAVPVRPLSR